MFVLLAVASILVGVLELISTRLRRKIRVIVAVSFGVFLAANLGIVVGVLARSHPERKMPKVSVIWRTNQFKVPSDINTFAATRVMVFPDDSHLVLEWGGKLSLLDAQTGQFVAEADLEGFQPYIFASSNGNVVVCRRPPSSVLCATEALEYFIRSDRWRGKSGLSVRGANWMAAILKRPDKNYFPRH